MTRTASTTRTEEHARTFVYSPSHPLSLPGEEGRETQHKERRAYREANIDFIIRAR